MGTPRLFAVFRPFRSHRTPFRLKYPLALLNTLLTNVTAGTASLSPVLCPFPCCTVSLSPVPCPCPQYRVLSCCTVSLSPVPCPFLLYGIPDPGTVSLSLLYGIPVSSTVSFSCSTLPLFLQYYVPFPATSYPLPQYRVPSCSILPFSQETCSAVLCSFHQYCVPFHRTAYLFPGNISLFLIPRFFSSTFPFFPSSMLFFPSTVLLSLVIHHFPSVHFHRSSWNFGTGPFSPASLFLLHNCLVLIHISLVLFPYHQCCGSRPIWTGSGSDL